MTEANIDQIFAVLVAAAQSGSWMYAVAALLMALTWCARKYGGEWIPFLKTDAGGVATTFALAFFGALVAAGPVAFSWGLVGTAVKVAIAAMGGYAGIRKLLVPAFSWLLSKLGVRSAASKIAEAERAGDEAVKAKPAPGAGKSRDVP